MVRDSACRARRKDGRPCRSAVVLPSGYCPMHDPGQREAMAAARARGGRGKTTTARLDRLVLATLKPVLARLIDALEEVHGDGDKAPTLSPQQASAMASLAGAIVKLYQTGVMEERLQALEEAHQAQDTRGRA